MVFQLTQKLVFPDPHYGEPDGLLAVGGDLSVDRRPSPPCLFQWHIPLVCFP